MTPAPDIARIAEGLGSTEVRKVTIEKVIDARPLELLRLMPSEWRLLRTIVFPKHAQPFVMVARRLKRDGLIESYQDGGTVLWRVTPLGLSVLQYLEEQGK